MSRWHKVNSPEALEKWPTNHTALLIHCPIVSRPGANRNTCDRPINARIIPNCLVYYVHQVKIWSIGTEFTHIQRPFLHKIVHWERFSSDRSRNRIANFYQETEPFQLHEDTLSVLINWNFIPSIILHHIPVFTVGFLIFIALRLNVFY